MHGGGVPVGNINLRGRKSKLLRCGCCEAIDVRDEVLEKEHRREMLEAVVARHKPAMDAVVKQAHDLKVELLEKAASIKDPALRRAALR